MSREQGKNIKPHIPHSRPTLGQDEIAAVSEVIASGHVVQGKKVEAFENAVAEGIGVPYAAAVSSGTSAIFLALSAMGIGKGDEVIIPSFVCTALLNAVQFTGAAPILADIEKDSFNVDPRDVKKRLTSKTKAIIVPHMFGAPANMEALNALDVPVVEDCAQALGAVSAGTPVGSSGFAAVFSFYATKVISTGEGGMVASRSKRLVENVKDMREYDNRKTLGARFNFKLTDMQAAMGLVQLARLPDFIRERRKIARAFTEAFTSLDVGLPQMDADNTHIFYRYVLRVKSEDAGEWIDYLTGRMVDCARPVFEPLHNYLKYQDYPKSDLAWHQALSIPIYPMLSKEDIRKIIDEVCLAGRIFGSK